MTLKPTRLYSKVATLVLLKQLRAHPSTFPFKVRMSESCSIRFVEIELSSRFYMKIEEFTSLLTSSGFTLIYTKKKEL